MASYGQENNCHILDLSSNSRNNESNEDNSGKSSVLDLSRKVSIQYMYQNMIPRIQKTSKIKKNGHKLQRQHFISNVLGTNFIPNITVTSTPGPELIYTAPLKTIQSESIYSGDLINSQINIDQANNGKINNSQTNNYRTNSSQVSSSQFSAECINRINNDRINYSIINNNQPITIDNRIGNNQVIVNKVNNKISGFSPSNQQIVSQISHSESIPISESFCFLANNSDTISKVTSAPSTSMLILSPQTGVPTPTSSLDTNKKVTRPFKAYPNHPQLFREKETYDENMETKYQEFREQMRETLKQENRTNSKMRRIPNRSGSPTSTVGEEKDAAYWEKRKRNNEAAKRSRDARRAKEDELAIRLAFIEKQNIKYYNALQAIIREAIRLKVDPIMPTIQTIIEQNIVKL